jgi:fatty-acyl-CoA synthase
VSDEFLDLLARSGSSVEVDDGVLTGPDLVAAGRDLAESWGRSGLRPGDRIGLWLANGRCYLEGLAACAAGGYVAVSVNTRWSPVEAEALLARSGARWLRSADGDRPVTAATGADPIAPFDDGDRPFVVFTTSGTTSRPKMVVHGQRPIVVHGHDAAAGFGYCADDVELGPIMVVMPLCGVFGLTSFVAAVAAGAPIIMPSTIDPVAIARRVEQDRIRAMNGSDDLFHRMLEAGGGRFDLSSLETGGYARFNTSLDGIVERAERRGMILTGLYGMSEVQALYSVRDPHGDASERQQAGGTVVSDRARARVVDGELQLRGPSLFAGYLSEGGASIDAALTAAAFTDATLDGGAWFRTGDAAEMQQPVDGRDTFVYQARLGDVLRLGGFLVAPAEIEAALIDFPGIDAAQVVAVDLPTGARPVAFVTGPCSVDLNFDEEAAIDHCAARLARFKVPIRVLPVGEFPTTPSANGTKIQKVKLREQAAAVLADDS